MHATSKELSVTRWRWQSRRVPSPPGRRRLLPSSPACALLNESAGKSAIMPNERSSIAGAGCVKAPKVKTEPPAAAGAAAAAKDDDLVALD